ncbi:hypothetical protein AB672_03320 [Xylella taiwanensis]|nr:hypothetical protein AB672_03320 [Xylella taiwanensis]
MMVAAFPFRMSGASPGISQVTVVLEVRRKHVQSVARAKLDRAGRDSSTSRMTGCNTCWPVLLVLWPARQPCGTWEILV